MKIKTIILPFKFKDYISKLGHDYFQKTFSKEICNKVYIIHP